MKNKIVGHSTSSIKDSTFLPFTISIKAAAESASANVVLSDISNKHGHPITFKSYFKVGFPFMIASVFVSMIVLIIKAYI